MSEENRVSAAESLARLEQKASFGLIGHLPMWRQVEAQHVEPGIRELLKETESAFLGLEKDLQQQKKLADAITWENLMDPMERISVRLGQALGAVMHLSG